MSKRYGDNVFHFFMLSFVKSLYYLKIILKDANNELTNYECLFNLLHGCLFEIRRLPAMV